MKRFSRMSRTKKLVAAGLTVGLTLGLAGAAFAFFTSTGTGTGSATVGTASATWSVASTTATGGALYPDAAIGTGHIDTITYSVKNNGSGTQSLNQVVISVANSDGSTWSSQTNMSDPACDASDFSIDAQPVGQSDTDTSLAGSVLAGATATGGSVTIQMIDNGANQDNCQGVTVPLYFSAS